MGQLKIKWNSERILSLSAMSISFITLVIFIYQTNLMSRQNDLSILPYMQMSTSNDPSAYVYGLSLKNHGVGPAILESVVLDYKGEKYNLKDYNNDLFAFLKSQKPALDSLNYNHLATLDPGIAFPPNTTYKVLSVEHSEEAYRVLTKSLDELLKEGMRYEITYKSIQGERWVIHNDSEGPEKLD